MFDKFGHIYWHHDTKAVPFCYFHFSENGWEDGGGEKKNNQNKAIHFPKITSCFPNDIDFMFCLDKVSIVKSEYIRYKVAHLRP